MINFDKRSKTVCILNRIFHFGHTHIQFYVKYVENKVGQLLSLMWNAYILPIYDMSA